MRTKRNILISLAAVSLAGAAADNKPITLLSAGSTYIYPILGKWCAEYRNLHPEVQVSYEPVGSGHGMAARLPVRLISELPRPPHGCTDPAFRKENPACSRCTRRQLCPRTTFRE